MFSALPLLSRTAFAHLMREFQVTWRASPARSCNTIFRCVCPIAKAAIRAAVRYLLEGTSGSDRGDIVQEIITIVSEVARGLQPDCYDPLDDAMPGG
jgi:hypothetical protein